MSANREPEMIERDIRETRAEMETTIEALRAKLSADELVGQTLNYIRQSGADVGEGFMERVRSNPLPLALMAASIAWLMVSDSRGRRRPYGETEGETFPERRAEGTGPSAEPLDDADFRTISQYERVFRSLADVRPRMDETAESLSSRYYPAMATALELQQESEEKTEDFKNRIDAAFEDLSTRAQRAQEKFTAAARSQWQRTREGAREAAETVAGQARQAGEQAGDFYMRYPLAAGGLALALGAVLGAALPSSRQEREWVGRMGEDLRRGVSDVAGRAATAAKETAKAEDLTQESAKAGARDLADRVRRTGEAAVKAGREESERKLATGTSGREETE